MQQPNDQITNLNQSLIEGNKPLEKRSGLKIDEIETNKEIIKIDEKKSKTKNSEKANVQNNSEYKENNNEENETTDSDRITKITHSIRDFFFKPAFLGISPNCPILGG